MTEFPGIRNILSSAFSVQTGLEDNAARQMLLREYRANQSLRDEIASALADASTSWIELLANRDYEVFEADTNDEARAIAIELFRV